MRASAHNMLPLPSRVAVDHVHAQGHRFDNARVQATEELYRFVESSDYMCLIYPDGMLDAVLGDVRAHCLPPTQQLLDKIETIQ